MAPAFLLTCIGMLARSRLGPIRSLRRLLPVLRSFLAPAGSSLLRSPFGPASACSHVFRSAQRPPVICSPALLRRPEEHITSGRFRFAQLPAVSPLAPHRARPCAPPGSLVQIITPAAAQRGRAQLALCAIMPSHAALRALRIARCLVPLILPLCYGKTLRIAVRRLFRIWDEKQLAVVPLRSSSSSTEFSGPPSSFRRTQYFRPPRSAQTPERGFFFFPFASLRIILSLRFVLHFG